MTSRNPPKSSASLAGWVVDSVTHWWSARLAQHVVHCYCSTLVVDRIVSTHLPAAHSLSNPGHVCFGIHKWILIYIYT